MRRFIDSAAGWAFGLGVTVLLVSIWGRAVVVDSDSLGEALTPLSQSSVVADRFADWIRTELVDNGADGGLAGSAIDSALAEPAVDEVLNRLILETVAAAADPDPGGATVDVAAVVAPAIPEIAWSLNVAGVPVAEEQVQRAVSELEPLVIRGPGLSPVIGPSSRFATRLGIAAMLALAVMGSSGALVIRRAPNRMAALRGLLVRVSLGGLSFALMLRLGSWILDPEGGRAPVSEALAGVADVKWLVPLAVAAASAAVAIITWVLRRRVRPVAETRSPSEQPIPQSG